MVDVTMWVSLIIKIVFLVLGTIITGYIIPTVKSNNLKNVIIALVRTAEQTLKDKVGTEKKRYVLDWLKDHDMYYDEDIIDALLESAVYNMNVEAKKALEEDKKEE